MKKREPKKNWSLTSDAFQRLLIWLGDEGESEGQNYVKMRQRLVSYFDRKNCTRPDELADETLNRVARRLDEEGGEIEIETPAKYCYITARFVFLESLRSAELTTISLENIATHSPHRLAVTEPDADDSVNTEMLEYLKRCMGQMDAAGREIITRYYYGRERIKIENRRALAAQLGITLNALAIRACRIRDRLEICVKKCVAGG
jgi:DNA-directed RNA polymerase specialized sigma24 family protein